MHCVRRWGWNWLGIGNRKAREQMAGISKRFNGHWIVRFVDAEGKRRTVAVGSKSERQATFVMLKIENIVVAKKTGQPVDPETATWLSKLKGVLRRRLSSVGLIESVTSTGAGKPQQMTIGSLQVAFTSVQAEVKESTKITYGNVRRHLLDFFEPTSLCAKSRPVMPTNCVFS